MTHGEDYWKDAYSASWKNSSEKEKAFRAMVKERTGLELVPNGLGAESTEMIHGSAQKSGYEMGAPDYRVEGTNIFIEVTGPLTPTVDPRFGLWLRPDKLKYAFMHRKEQKEYFVLYFPRTKEWLCVEAGEEFFKDYVKRRNEDDYILKTPTIRGRKERYYCINYDNWFVHRIDYLYDKLREIA